ncbi:hypothetical protein Poli38472_007497 [Pythium oligandrum]|uniref:Phospholipid/glycerol acyltransferase domain-containing protein n=1 Tax=Pythium oligandrum TaxID=41045 RepID=A0A8K1CQS5_PYTOL|nr:hypothetical protein Poli38472_007497 [Pythium oligandrum]|eukprot:TMW67825.1 hypothetical protein Poli38472_007497 [Pythium oligandrum]
MRTLISPDQHGGASLDMDAHSAVAADIRVGLDAIGDGRVDVHLDSVTDSKLQPFSSMFQFERIKSPYHFGHVLLLLYAPIGVVLMCLRIFLAFLFALLVPRCFSEQQLDRMGMHKLTAFLSGTIVIVEDEHNFDRTQPAEIIASNHISEFDAVAVRILTPSYVLGYDFYKKMLFFKLLGDKFGLLYVPYVSRQQGGGAGRDQIREIIQEKLSRGDKPISFFPEGGLTNGRKGLLQYHKFLFSLGRRIQPLAIQASDGPFPVNINDETSTFLANVLWYFFVPYHVYRIKCLPVTRAEPDEDALAFAQRVMKQTARALKQDATPFLYRDKIAYTRFMTRQINKAKK